MQRRTLLLGTAALPALDRAAHAQAAPQEIRMVVPFAAGGATDLLARRLQPILEKKGHKLVVENATGGGAVVGSQKVAYARPDGTTVGLLSSGLLGQIVAGETTLKLEHFTNLVRVAVDPAILITGAKGPLRTLDDAIALFKAGGATAGAAGAIGTGGHLRLSSIARELGAEFVYVGYPGASRLAGELLGGHVALGMVKPNDVFGQIRSGEIRVLAVFGERRLPQLPDVPTVAERGLNPRPYGGMPDNFTYAGAPVGLAPATRDALVSLLREAILSAEYQAKANEDCYIADALSGAPLEAEIQATMASLRRAQESLRG
jgi:tripartite-type tricarboxylate transporter receptor subunit TctC